MFKFLSFFVVGLTSTGFIYGDNAPEIDDHVIDHLTNPFNKSGETDKTETLGAAASMSVQQMNFVPEIIFGDIKNAKLKVTIYSAPTCTHCAEYHHEVLPKVLELTKNKPVAIVMRIFIANLPWDLVASKITWIFGKEKQHEMMDELLKNQKIWLIPSAFNKHNNDEKKKYADLVNAALADTSQKINVPVEELKTKLQITEDDVTALLKLFALYHFGICVDVLSCALNNKELERDLLLMTLKAKDDQGKLLNFTPAIYVQKHPDKSIEQGYLQKDNLTAEQIDKLLTEALNESPLKRKAEDDSQISNKIQKN